LYALERAGREFRTHQQIEVGHQRHRADVLIEVRMNGFFRWGGLLFVHCVWQVERIRGGRPQKKPGNKGDFHGVHLEYLLSRLEEYLTTSKVGQTRVWWPKLMKEYWEKFHWHLNLAEEPVEGDVSRPDNALSAADALLKTKRMEDIKQVSSSRICGRKG
jgi:hypothetical protein